MAQTRARTHNQPDYRVLIGTSQQHPHKQPRRHQQRRVHASECNATNAFALIGVSVSNSRELLGRILTLRDRVARGQTSRASARSGCQANKCVNLINYVIKGRFMGVPGAMFACVCLCDTYPIIFTQAYSIRAILSLLFMVSG